MLARDVDVEDETVSVDRVMKALDPAKRLRLVILDACRDNPFTRSIKRGVDRDQIIVAVDFDSMTGVVDDRDIGVVRDIGEVAHRASQAGSVEIEPAFDDVEPGAPKQRCHRPRVIDRIGELGHALIGGIADHQRHASVGVRIRHGHSREDCQAKNAETHGPAVRYPPRRLPW